MYKKLEHSDGYIRNLTSLKQSILEAMEHLLARKREIRPLFFEPALPIKDEWNISPYFGVLPERWNIVFISMMGCFSENQKYKSIISPEPQCYSPAQIVTFRFQSSK